MKQSLQTPCRGKSAVFFLLLIAIIGYCMSPKKVSAQDVIPGYVYVGSINGVHKYMPLVTPTPVVELVKKFLQDKKTRGICGYTYPNQISSTTGKSVLYGYTCAGTNVSVLYYSYIGAATMVPVPQSCYITGTTPSTAAADSASPPVLNLPCMDSANSGYLILEYRFAPSPSNPTGCNSDQSLLMVGPGTPLPINDIKMKFSGPNTLGIAIITTNGVADLDRVVLEYSSDGKNFSEAQTLQNVLEQQTTIEDNGYYRIKILSPDGSLTLSSVMRISSMPSQLYIPYWNIENQTVWCDGSSSATITDMTKRVVMSVNGDQKMYLSRLTPGIYFYQPQATKKGEVIPPKKIIVSSR